MNDGGNVCEHMLSQYFHNIQTNQEDHWVNYSLYNLIFGNLLFLHVQWILKISKLRILGKS